MADDAVDIRVSDNISASIAKKFRDIATAAREAYSDIELLKKSIAGLSTASTAFAKATTNANTLRTAAKQAGAQLASMSAQAGYLGARLQTVNQQARAAAQGFTRLQAGAAKTAPVMQNISSTSRQLLGYLAAFAGVHAFVEAATEAQTLRNQVDLVTNSNKELLATQTRLFDLAKETHTGIDATTRLYTRLKQALQGAEVSTEDVWKMTETLNKAVQATGRTSSEASSAILQFTQAMAKGKLDGDEFRSLLENLPILGKALETQLGVTRGELLKLAPQGKITMGVLVEALRTMRAETEKAFSNMTLTIDQALTDLHTSFVQFMSDNSGATNLLANAIEFLSQNLNTVIPVVLAFGAAWAAVQIANIINDFRLLTVAMLTSKVAIVAIVAQFVLWTSLVIGLTYAFAAMIDTIWKGLGGVPHAVEDVNKLFNAFLGVVGSVANGLVGVGTASAKEFSPQVDKATASTQALTTSVGTTTTAMNDNTTATNAAAAANQNYAEGYTQQIAPGIQKVVNNINTLRYSMSEASSAADKLYASLQKVGKSSNATTVLEYGGANSFQNITGNMSGHSIQSLGSNAKGGSYMIGGRQSGDQNVVKFRANKGERVDIKTRRQQRQEGNGTMIHSDNRVVHFNVVTPDADSFNRSSRQVASSFKAIVG